MSHPLASRISKKQWTWTDVFLEQCDVKGHSSVQQTSEPPPQLVRWRILVRHRQTATRWSIANWIQSISSRWFGKAIWNVFLYLKRRINLKLTCFSVVLVGFWNLLQTGWWKVLRMPQRWVGRVERCSENYMVESTRQETLSNLFIKREVEREKADCRAIGFSISQPDVVVYRDVWRWVLPLAICVQVASEKEDIPKAGKNWTFPKTKAHKYIKFNWCSKVNFLEILIGRSYYHEKFLVCGEFRSFNDVDKHLWLRKRLPMFRVVWFLNLHRHLISRNHVGGVVFSFA